VVANWTDSITNIFPPKISQSARRSRSQRPPVQYSAPRQTQDAPRRAKGPLSQWAERRVQRMAYIFQAQGYSGAKLGKIIRGAKHIVLPVRPSLYDIAQHNNLHQRWLSLATNVAKATATRSYAEWDNDIIHYFLELPQEFWKTYRLSELDGQAIGMTEYKKPIQYRFSEAYPHALVAGATGAGKSVALETIIFALTRTHTPRELGLIIIDPHHSLGSRPEGDVGSFDNLEHLLMPIARTPQAIDAAFQYGYNQLAHRKTNNIRGAHVQRIIIIADELSSAHVLGRKDEQNKRNLLIANTLGAEARKFRINLVAGTQKPEEVDTELFDHLNYRFVGKVSNNMLGTRILGRPGFKLADLSGQGDFFVSADRVRRFQFALPERTDFEHLSRAEISPVEVESQDIGRIPIEAESVSPEKEPVQVTVVNQPKKSSAGAKVKQTDPEKIAFYIYYGPDNITEADARVIDCLQLKRSLHERHRNEARVLVEKLAELQAANIPFDQVSRNSQLTKLTELISRK